MADTRDAAPALPPAPNKKHLSPFAALDALKRPQKRRGKPSWHAAGAASARFSICSGAPAPLRKRSFRAMANRETLKVWELESGRALRTLQGHAASVNSVAVTPDGRLTVSASADQTVKVWELTSSEITILTLALDELSDQHIAAEPGDFEMDATSAFSEQAFYVLDGPLCQYELGPFNRTLLLRA